MNKQLIRIFAFLPFLLAIAFAVKIYLDRLDGDSNTHFLHPPTDAPITKRMDGVANIQVALLLDISGSMDGLIDQAKSQLWQIVNELGEAKYRDTDPNLEISLYIYGGDDLDAREGYVKQMTPLTTDLDLISEKLFELTTNGGEEYCGKVIETSLLELDWTKKAEDLRLIFIAGNEPFSQGPVLYKQACNAALQQDIIVNTIFCGDYAEGVSTQWKEGAEAGGGQYLNIDHNQELATIETPFDDEILALNTKLNGTYIAYGTRGAELSLRQSIQDDNAGKVGKSIAVTRGIAKTKSHYMNKHWDLVDAAKEKDFELEDVREGLGEELSKMSEEELSSFIEEKQQERDSIQEAIADLDKKRSAFIQEKKREEAEELTLDKALVKAVRSIAEEKTYNFQ
ncbi:MAG: hypothetical protein AAF587_34795 [Bacteroidota bacterium]